MSSLSWVKNIRHYRYAVFVAMLVVVGLWLRIRNLGALSLIVDEGVQALAVEAILKNGAEMETGLVYLRGPLYLYTQAVLAYLFELNEFWLRFPSVIFGTAVIIPVYILGKRLFNRPVGALSATIIALSAWEVEMSRYARVYIAFQFFFLVSLIFFYRGFLLGEYKSKVLFLVASFCTFLTHELSQVLGTLFLIPLLMPAFSWRKKMKVVGWAVGLGGLLFAARQVNGIHLPSSASWVPEDGGSSTGLLSQLTNTLGIPALNGPDLSPFFRAFQHDFLAVVVLLLVVGGTAVYLLYRAFRGGEWGQAALGLLMLCAAAVYQFGVVLLFFIVYLLLYARDTRILKDRVLLSSFGAASVCFAGWFLILVRSSDLILVEVPLLLFGFPAFYKYLFRWLAEGWPVMTLILSVGSVWLFLRYLRDRSDKQSLFLVGALYVPALSASLFESHYVPEYTLHLYPLVALIVSAVVWKASALAWQYFGLRNVLPKRGLFIFAVPLILLASPDTNPVSAWQIGERTYQSEKPPVRNVMTYRFYSDYHPDVEGVSQYVKEHISEGDKIAVVGPSHIIQIADFYIGNVDFAITDNEAVKTHGIIRNKKQIHYTSGCKFITKVEELKSEIKGQDGSVWVIGDYRTLSKKNPWVSNSNLKGAVRRLTQQPDYVARDGITFVKEVR